MIMLSLSSNSVTRQVTCNKPKLCEKYQNSKIENETFRVVSKHCDLAFKHEILNFIIKGKSHACISKPKFPVFKVAWKVCSKCNSIDIMITKYVTVVKNRKRFRSNFWLSLAQKFIDSSLKVRWWKRKLIFPSLIDFCNRVVQKEIQFLWKKSEELGNEHDAIRKSMSRNFCQHLVNGRLLKRGQGHSHFFSWKCPKV